ncbi:hypothetical protein [Amycolatopsis thermoflava]|uniref:hypothetical protein n=1 Tax=Amycolatopsis thermoflava TaxID=84480 RepID=UPI000404005E|nr:hypothetical protein [Amycolatopsis thermoflava]
MPARLDTIEELQCFAKWCRRIGGEPRNRGESSVFAEVERHGGVAITDDRDAVRVGRAYDLSVHGSL